MSDIYQAKGTLVTGNKEVEAEAVVTKEDDGPIARLVEPAPTPAVIMPSTRVIYFGFDKTDLTPGSLQELKQVYKSLMKEPRLLVELSGHADVRVMSATMMSCHVSGQKQLKLISYKERQ